MQMNITILSRAALLCLLLTSVAAAGPLSLETDGTTGLPGWHATQSTWNSATKIKATIEYAVYAPGMFDQSVLLGNPADPSFDLDYVYAYEVSLVTTAPLLYLSVSTVAGVIPMSYVGTNRVDSWSSPNGGQAPITEIFNAGVSVVNARWSFSPTVPLSTGYSTILFFTSPFGPQFNNAAISGGGSQINTTTLPSPNPVPEPTTLTLAAIAVVSLFAARRLRRHAA